MHRWTMKQLKETSDLALINAFLEERRPAMGNPYTPLNDKINEIKKKLKSGSRFDQDGNLVVE